MNQAELLSYIDTFQKGRGHYTKDEQYSICCAYKSLPQKEKNNFPWTSLIAYCGFLNEYGTPYTVNGIRKWVNKRNRRCRSGLNVIDEEVRSADIILHENRMIKNRYAAMVREQSKLKYLKDGLIAAIREMPSLPIIHKTKHATSAIGGYREAILMLSDWHIGMLTDHELNKFNFKIACERIEKVIEDTRHYIKQYHITTLHILNLGDLIHGKIHRDNQIAQEFDVNGQIVRAFELMSHILLELARDVPHLYYHSVVDNHSALESDKNKRNSKENLSQLIDMFIKERLKPRKIIFPESSFNCSISSFKLHNGQECGAVHGDKDTTQTIFQNIVGALQKYVHIICSSHVHHFSTRDFQRCLIFINSSLCGPDDHSVDLRKFSRAGQKLIIFDTKNIVDINIMLDNIR